MRTANPAAKEDAVFTRLISVYRCQRLTGGKQGL